MFSSTARRRASVPINGPLIRKVTLPRTAVLARSSAGKNSAERKLINPVLDCCELSPQSPCDRCCSRSTRSKMKLGPDVVKIFISSRLLVDYTVCVTRSDNYTQGVFVLEDMEMLKKLVATTDNVRRSAMQIAVQLPENVDEARATLAQAQDLLENFLVRDRMEAVQFGESDQDAPLTATGAFASGASRRGGPPPLAAGRAALATVALIFVFVPAAIGLGRLTGLESVSGWILSAGIILTALVFGSGCSAFFAVCAAIAHSYILAVLSVGFSFPSAKEIIATAGFFGLALALPPLVRSVEALRRWISSFRLAVPAGR